jgi:hypothetical protein
MLRLVACIPPRLDLLVVYGAGTTAPEGGFTRAVSGYEKNGGANNQDAHDTQDHREYDDQVSVLIRHRR